MSTIEKFKELTNSMKMDLIKDIHIILSSYIEGSYFVFDKRPVNARLGGDAGAFGTSYLVTTINTDGDLRCVLPDWSGSIDSKLEDLATHELALLYDTLNQELFQLSLPSG